MLVYGIIATIISCFVFIWLLPKYLKTKKLKIKNDIYKDITLSMLNSDPKTRKAIEKQCNEYLEHKVNNSNYSDKSYLDQCYLILDNIKYLNMIYAVEPIEEKEKEKSIIEKAIDNNKELDKKVGKTKKGENK